MGAELLHPGCTDLAWDGAVLAAGLGHLWRLGPDGRWQPQPLRPLHGVHHEGPRRAVDVVGPYVYTEGSTGWRATAQHVGDHVLPHPSGAVAFARDGVVHRAALPGRTPRDLPELRADSLRFAPRGDRLMGLGVDGPVSIDLASGLGAPLPGLPLGDGVCLVDGRVLRGDEVLHEGLLDVSPAIGPSHVAGPGGRLWPRGGHAPVDAPLALGATLPLGSGFATVPYEGPEGWWVDVHGQVLARFDVPLEPDDMVVGLRLADGALWADTAYGARLRLLDTHEASDGIGSTQLRTVSTPLGPVPDALLLVDGPRHLVVAEAGWLLSWEDGP